MPQVLLPRCTVIRLWFRRTRSCVPKEIVHRRSYHGMGHRRGRDHDQYCRCLSVSVSLRFCCGCPQLPYFQMHIATTASPDDRFAVSTFVSRVLTVSEQGEISALVNLARTLGGFSVAYFQVPWATKHGALQTFGVEAACAISSYFRTQLFTDDRAKNSIVVGLFLLVVPTLQLKGRYLQVCDMLNCWLHALTS